MGSVATDASAQDPDGAQRRHVSLHGYFVPSEPRASEPRLTISELWASARRHWIVIAPSIGAACAAALVVAHSAAPNYRASALVRVVEESERLGGPSALADQLGGLTSLAARLPGGSGRVEAVAVLKSGSLAEEFISTHELTRLLFAADWDDQAKRWRPQIRGGPPTMADAVKRFSDRVRIVQEDKLSGLVTVTIRWRDPRVAAEWANALVNLANARMRARAIDESKRSIEFLKSELRRTNNLELQRAISRLMQAQINTATLASVRSEFALKTLDPARAPDPDDYVWPRPLVLLAFGLVIGTLIGGLLALLRERSHFSR